VKLVDGEATNAEGTAGEQRRERLWWRPVIERLKRSEMDGDCRATGVEGLVEEGDRELNATQRCVASTGWAWSRGWRGGEGRRRRGWMRSRGCGGGRKRCRRVRMSRGGCGLELEGAKCGRGRGWAWSRGGRVGLVARDVVECAWAEGWALSRVGWGEGGWGRGLRGVERWPRPRMDEAGCGQDWCSRGRPTLSGKCTAVHRGGADWVSRNGRGMGDQGGADWVRG
jgi:hypothetical protein